MATGELRATMALTEPGGGSDLQAMLTTAKRDGDDYVINGSKTWILNARRSDLVAVLCKTDPEARPKHKGVSILLVEKGPGFTLSRDLPKLGYKGVESCEIAFEQMRVPVSSLLGESEGTGFAQMMRGLEVGRLQVAGRALGVGRAALEDSLKYAQERESFRVPIWKHQSIGNYLADMVTKLTAARQMTLYAARKFDSGQRADMEAGMAKLFASEAAMQIALDGGRIHGGYGYSTEFEVERYFRDAPLMIVGEGTNEIQRNAHRIHYDHKWVREEGYGDLVVHGPLQALLMGELIRRGGEGLVGRQFVYRLVAPMIGPQTFTVAAGQDGVNAGVEFRDVHGTVTAVSTVGPIA